MGCCQERPFLLIHRFSQKDTGILFGCPRGSGPQPGIGVAPFFIFGWWSSKLVIFMGVNFSQMDPKLGVQFPVFRHLWELWLCVAPHFQPYIVLWCKEDWIYLFQWDFIALGPCKGCCALAWERVQVPLMKAHCFNSLVPFLFSLCLLMSPKYHESTSQLIEYAQPLLIPEGAWHLAGRNVC